MRKICFMLAVVLAFGLSGCDAEPAPDRIVESIVERDMLIMEVTHKSATLHTDGLGIVWLQTIIEITNIGSMDMHLFSGGYDLEDTEGNHVASRSMVACYPDVISPGEKAYYYENVPIEDVDAGTELVVIPNPEYAQAEVPITRFETPDFELHEDELSGLQMIGSVKNTSNEKTDTTCVACVLYDSKELPIGLIVAPISEPLAAGDTADFEAGAGFLPDEISIDTVADTVVYAYPVQNQNLTRPKIKIR